MDNFIVLLLVITCALVGATYLLHRFLKNKIIKYSPGILIMLLGFYFLLLAKNNHNGFDGLAYLMSAVMLMWAALSNLATCVVIDFLIPFLRENNK